MMTLFAVLLINSFISFTEPVSLENELDTGYVYKIDLGLFKDSASVKQIKKWEEICNCKLETYKKPKYNKDGKLAYTYIYYYAGNFKNEDDAKKFLEELKIKGVKSAYVQLFINGKRHERLDK